MIRFIDAVSALTPADLDDVERRFGFELPTDLRQHYLRYNGGYPEKDRFVDERGTSVVQGFLPVKYGKTSLTLESTIRRLKVDQQIIPNHLIPFAVDPGGNYYCFSARADDFGTICLFRVGCYGDPARAVEVLASSFARFLDALQAKE